MDESERYCLMLGLVVSLIIAALTIPTPILAEANCSIDELPRESKGNKRRLAVRTTDGWQYFTQNDSETAHDVKIGTLELVCLAWEAPPYPGSRAQIVYASTQHRKDQPLWLFRNSAVALVPLIKSLIGNWKRMADRSGNDPDQVFKAFHENRSDDRISERRIAEWHDTSLWGANADSFELVSTAVADLNALPLGTERLLRLVPKRPLSS